MKVGVIGVGIVGFPLYKALQYYHKNVYCWDLNKHCDEWGDILSTEVVFICVPTYPKDNGRLDMSNVEENLEKLSNCKYKGIVVIKSTLGLGYINNAIKKYGNLMIFVFPEWLYAINAFPDTLKPEMTVIGVESQYLIFVDELLKACPWHKKEDAFIVKPEEAVMIKLTANALASTKISFANQIQLICEKYKINSEVVMNVIKQDPRCSPRYLTPGKPFGGHCLPKDFDELRKSIKDTHMFDGVKKINNIFCRRENK